LNPVALVFQASDEFVACRQGADQLHLGAIPAAVGFVVVAHGGAEGPASSRCSRRGKPSGKLGVGGEIARVVQVQVGLGVDLGMAAVVELAAEAAIRHAFVAPTGGGREAQTLLGQPGEEAALARVVGVGGLTVVGLRRIELGKNRSGPVPFMPDIEASRLAPFSKRVPRVARPSTVLWLERRAPTSAPFTCSAVRVTS
jgi:hypothetical protein